MAFKTGPNFMALHHKQRIVAYGSREFHAYNFTGNQGISACVQAQSTLLGILLLHS